VPAEPLVSVVMIFLNGEEFIDAAIRSVIAQTYPSWELILVDDGSSDGSSRIARQYAASESNRIRYFEHAGHANRGTGPSRNLGLMMATGSYAAFLDADDLYLPERLARHVAVLESEPHVGLVVSQDLYWRTWLPEAQRDPRSVDEILGPAVPRNVSISPPLLWEFTLCQRGAAVPATCSITFRRSLALELGAIPENFVDQYEDQVLIAKLMLATPCVVLREHLAKYRQHPTSLTARAAQRNDYRPGRPHQRRFEFLQWLRDYAAVAAPGAIALQAAVHRQLWPTRHPVLSAAYDNLRSMVRGTRLAAARLVPAAAGAQVRSRWHEQHRKKLERRLDRRLAATPPERR
jgi:glycosyltransferase involved in cell wall biosynthesis